MPRLMLPPILIIGFFLAALIEPAGAQSNDAIFRFLAGPAEVGNILRNGIAIDQQGFVWLAGSNRIIRHDGTRAQTFMLPESDIDPAVECFVFGLTIAPDGTVWGSSRRGVVRLRPDDDHLRFVFAKDGKAPDINDDLGGPVTDIALDQSGRLWFVSGKTLRYFDTATEKIVNVDWSAAPVAPDFLDFPLGLEASEKGTLWVVFRNGTIGRLPVGETQFEFTDVSGFMGSPEKITQISALRALDSDRILIATYGGLFELNMNAKSWREIVGQSPALTFGGDYRLRDLIVGHDGSYWLGTRRAGLVRLDPKTGRSWNYRHDTQRASSLPSDQVRSLFEGPQGSIWVGTASGYALLESTEAFGLIPYASRSSDNLRTVRPGVAVQAAGRVWSIREEAVLSVVEIQTGEQQLIHDFAALEKPNATFFLMMADSVDNVWIASRSTGLVRFDAQLRQTIYPIDAAGKQGLPNHQVMAFTIDDRDRVVVCHYDGLSRLDPSTGLVEVIESPFLDINERMLMRMFRPQGQGRVWGTVNKGRIFSIADDDRRVEVHLLKSRSAELPAPTVLYDVHETAEGTIYIAARNGLFRWDEATGICDQIPETRAATNAGAFGILVDRKGSLWIPSHWNGLLRFQPETSQLVSYQPESVVGSLEYLNSQHTVAPDGRILIATHQGVLHFRPEDLPFPSPPVVPTVTAVRVMGEMRWNGRGRFTSSEIKISSTNDLVSIDFVSPNAARSDDILYSYRLPDLSDHWIPVSGRGAIEITQLPAGRFDFELQATSKSSHMSVTTSPLVLVVNLPLWQRPLIRGIAVAAILILLIILIYVRLRRVDRHARELQSEIEFREQSETERRSLEEQLLHAMKLEAVGKLAGGVAHDFNNILTAIIGHAELLKSGLAEQRDNAELSEDVDAMLKASDRAVRLTQQLLTFSRRDQIAPELIDPGPVLDEMKSMLTRLIRADIKLEVRRDFDLGRVLADSIQLEQIILNLVVNAVDAMPDGGLLEVEMVAIHLSNEERMRTRLGTKGALRIRVVDNGRGMEDAVKARIFEPYFTTKGVGEGSGLGLSTVHGIVRQMNGLISVHSQLGRGTTFEVLLPCPECSNVDASDRNIDLSNPDGPLVLVCEENTEVRALACRILEISGFRTKEAANPAAALQRITRLGEPPKILITDLLFTKGDGGELARSLRAQFPELQVLFVSGMKRESLDDELFADDQTAYLGKPFEMQSLIEAVRRLQY